MGFECYHPAINCIYFVCMFTGTFLFRHPVFLLISWLSAFLYSVKRNRLRSLVFNLCLIPLAVLFACYYSGYNHFGVTVLRYNFIDNRMTLESLLYGLTLGMQAAACIMWFTCLFSVFTTDKVVYLFGRVSPKASLFLAIALRMCPRVKAQGKKISTARKAIGMGANQGNLFRRLRNAVCIFSMSLTWLLESFSSVSDSMRSRGYGLKGRTAFSIYRFDNRDRSFVIGIFTCFTVVIMGMMLDQTAMSFAPRIRMTPITPLSCLFYAGYLGLCLLPPALELISELHFRRLRKGLLRE